MGRSRIWSNFGLLLYPNLYNEHKIFLHMWLKWTILPFLDSDFISIISKASIKKTTAFLK